VIALVAALALLQVLAIALTALVLVACRISMARAERRRAVLLDRYRDAVLELVAGEGEVPEELRKVRSAAEREAVGELMTRYADVVRGDARERTAAFAAERGYVAAASRDLRSLLEWRRGMAAKTLGDYGADNGALPLEEALLDDCSEQVRLVAARALGRVGADDACPALISSCKEGGVPPAVAAQALLDIGGDAVPWLASAATHPDPDVRAAACRVLGLNGVAGDADAMHALNDAALTDPEPMVRALACRAVGAVGDHESAVVLAAAMTDTEPEVRDAACDAARTLATPEVGHVLEALLDDPVPEVARSAARAAAALGIAATRRGGFLTEARVELARGWS
jgi:HEAT repeat protein